MKVKELIKQLEKQNQEDEIHVWVDDEVGAGGSDIWGRYYANSINIFNNNIYYQDVDSGEINNIKQIEKSIIEYYDNLTKKQIKEIIKKKIESMIKLEGCWLYIK